MAYLDQTDEHLLDDLVQRKEFAIYTNTIDDTKGNIIPRFLLEDVVGKEHGLKLHSYQRFVENFMNPNTSNTRLLMKWSPGMGKTIGSLSLALKFINYYNKMQSSGAADIGSVWILGFTENIFRSDLVKFPEFGFITESELQLINKLKELIHSGSTYDMEKLNELKMRINRRLTNRQGNGFFKFMGYKSLLNRLFLARDKDINLVSLSENEIADLIRKERVVLNLELMNEMKNSLLICDEIHDVYNSAEKNNWGVALQTILNHDPTIRAVFLSATPFNNSPTELIDLLNLLTPRSHFSEFKKSDFFTNDEKLIENNIPKLYKILAGRVSFITNNNPQFFPAKGFTGEKIPGISYLKFKRCPMSKFHYNTYKNIFIDKNTDDQHIGTDSQYIVDFALPDPKQKDPWSSPGIYKTGDIRSVYLNAPAQWKSKYKLNYSQENDILYGDILNMDNGDLRQISSKYTEMIKDIINVVTNGGGKIFIYHNVIHMSGVMFIGEILKANGFIDESSNSVDSTRCALCGKPRKDHSKDQLMVGGFRSKQKVPNGEKYSFELIEINDVNCKIFNYNKGEMHISFILDPYGLRPDADVKIGEIPINKKDLDKYDIILANDRQDISEWIKMLDNYEMHKLGNYYYYFSAPDSKTRTLTKSEVMKYVGKMLDNIPELAKTFRVIGGKDKDHKYMPCRYTLIHSNITRKVRNHNIDTFNSITNIWGDHLMILVGGKIMKQSINLVAVQNLMIMGRPDNIPTMLQINGRAIRTSSHVLLPPENRLVNISIYTSTLPDKSLSYEEIKYKEKVESFKIIQRLELILHEVAIDKIMNYNIIFQPQSDLQKKQHYELDILPYKLDKKIKYKLSDLNLETFNAYYGNEEVNTIKMLLKRIFIEQSPVWKFNDLFNAVKNMKNVNQDMQLISQENFILALDSLLIKENDKYIEPVIQSLHDAVESASLYDKLINPLEKYIYVFDGQKQGIVHIGDYYMMVPIDYKTGEVIVDIEMPYRTSHVEAKYSVRIHDYLLYDQKSNFNDKKEKFMKKWMTVDVRNLELAICDYGTSFHKKFAEECIEYVFNVWTNPKQKKSPYHVFYIKMLYYYDMRKVIIWAHTVSDKIFAKYKQWAIPVVEHIKDEPKEKKGTVSNGFINLLKTSINHNNMEWISTGMVTDFNKKTKESLALFDGNTRKSNAKTKINADYLPVGHFIGNIPRFYNPSGEHKWSDDISYLEKTTQYKENNIVIGYDDKTKTSINVKFKLRSPIQNIKQHKDTRQIEKGSVCTTKSKQFLQDVAKKLGLPSEEYNKVNIEDLCMKIRTRLIYYELKARSSGSNIKFFYFLHEIKPETMLGDYIQE
jgi:hypothetical protein